MMEENTEALGDEQSEPALPRGWRAVGKGSASVQTVETDIDDEAPVRNTQTVTETPDASSRLSTGAIFGFGMIIGVYVLYTVGWIFSGASLRNPAGLLTGNVMLYELVMWISVFACTIWFTGVLILTRKYRVYIRFLWLGIGVLLFIPWPFVMVGALG